ncbi:MAG: prolipoprotein diacylglyceryl transferase [Ruminococcus sp.]|nr:prolipoprotein diacylglyceryl transferase [Ruminococcus sp.]
MIQTLMKFATEIDSDIRDEMKANPDKVYFPNFGDSDNVLSNGITIDRVMFTIPGTDFKIYWYGFLIALGILVAMIYGYRKMKPIGIDPDRATDAIIGGFIGAILGARAYYIAFNDDVTFKDFFSYRDGGLAIYGALIGAIIVGGIIAKIRGLKLTALLDVAAPCFLIGQCIGRWGNFVNQEAFGSNTDLPWGMMSAKTISYIGEHYDDLGGTVSSYAPVHPCFLYESLWCLLCFIILHFYTKHRKFDGEVFLMYIGLYGFGRFFIEATRTDSLYIANIKVSQLVAGTCVLASIVLIIIFRSITARSNYKFFYQTELSRRQLAALEGYEANEKAKKELKKKISQAKKSGESFVELEKEYDEKFGKTAKANAKKLADETAAEKKELKKKIKEAKKSDDKDELTELKNEYAEKFGGRHSSKDEDDEPIEEEYESILGDEDDEEQDENAASDEKPDEQASEDVDDNSSEENDSDKE